MAVRLRPPVERDRDAFVGAVHRSRDLHRPWTTPPDSAEAFQRYLDRAARPTESCQLVLDDDDLVGVYNLSEIVRGAFQNAYLGYYAFTPFAGMGLMRAAMPLVFAHAFEELGLHRLQAAVQPDNERSRRLLGTTGWREEGFAQRYLFLDGAWRDHVLYAVTVEDLS
jgi:ribosomal-protein-alanine N-acetyltransferase